MEQNDTILTFDTLYTTNEIQILKLALPLLSAALRPYAALLIKGLELKYCLEQLPKNKIDHISFELSYLEVFLDNALPYCNEKQKEMLLQFKQIKQSMEMFKKMKDMMALIGEDGISDIGNLFQSFASSGPMSDVASGNFSPEELLRSSMSGEQAELFEMFKKKFEEDI